MPPGGVLRSSQHGLPVAITVPALLRTCGRMNVSDVVSTAVLTCPPPAATWLAVHAATTDVLEVVPA
jgi:hypothetical protein